MAIKERPQPLIKPLKETEQRLLLNYPDHLALPILQKILTELTENRANILSTELQTALLQLLQTVGGSELFPTELDKLRHEHFIVDLDNNCIRSIESDTVILVASPEMLKLISLVAMYGGSLRSDNLVPFHFSPQEQRHISQDHGTNSFINQTQKRIRYKQIAPIFKMIHHHSQQGLKNKVVALENADQLYIGLTLNPATREVKFLNKTLQLPPLHFLMISILSERVGQATSAQALAEMITARAIPYQHLLPAGELQITDETLDQLLIDLRDPQQWAAEIDLPTRRAFSYLSVCIEVTQQKMPQPGEYYELHSFLTPAKQAALRDAAAKREVQAAPEAESLPQLPGFKFDLAQGAIEWDDQRVEGFSAVELKLLRYYITFTHQKPILQNALPPRWMPDAQAFFKTHSLTNFHDLCAFWQKSLPDKGIDFISFLQEGNFLALVSERPIKTTFKLDEKKNKIEIEGIVLNKLISRLTKHALRQLIEWHQADPAAWHELSDLNFLLMNKKVFVPETESVLVALETISEAFNEVKLQHKTGLLAENLFIDRREEQTGGKGKKILIRLNTAIEWVVE